jgi:hypothetical protein
VNAFHIFGGLLAIWAVLVSFVGIRSEGFPRSGRAMRAVAAISVVLTALAIGSAIYVGATEEEEEGGHEAQASLFLPL